MKSVSSVPSVSNESSPESRVEPHREHQNAAEDDHAIDPLDLVRIAFVGIACLASWMGVWKHVATFDVIALAATIVGGYPIFKEAIANLAAGRMTMELSMTIALVAASAIGEFITALVIVFFVLIAELLEELTVGRGRDAIKDLLDLLPNTAVIQRSGRSEEIKAADLSVGDVVLVKPGSRIPVDGEVVKGTSFVDQSSITGESLPGEKLPGSTVYAGTINQSGMVEVRTVRVGRDTAYGKIIEAVEEAEQSKAPVEKLADRMAGYLVYIAVGCSGLTFLFTHNMRSTISVVIVAGACGIAAGTPLAILGAIGRAARSGAIIKGGLHLEALGTIDTVVLDKTGTLTLGDPVVDLVHAMPGVTPEQLLEAAAIAERASEHPLAKAILSKAAALQVEVGEPEQFSYVPGRGISCSYHGEQILVGSRTLLEEHGCPLDGLEAAAGSSTEVCVGRNGKLLGSLHVKDALRPESVKAVAALREMGLRPILLTGDLTAIANDVARKLGVDEVHAEMLPDQKSEKIKELIAIGKRVAMVGDGINDAPALAHATVGVAMGSGTDVARESADVILLGNDLMKFVDTLRIARRCRQIIWFNFYGTLAVDALGVGLAAFGFLNPLLAAFIHVTSELAFILNSARLLPVASGK